MLWMGGRGVGILGRGGFFGFTAGDHSSPVEATISNICSLWVVPRRGGYLLGFEGSCIRAGSSGDSGTERWEGYADRSVGAEVELLRMSMWGSSY